MRGLPALNLVVVIWKTQSLTGLETPMPDHGADPQRQFLHGKPGLASCLPVGEGPWSTCPGWLTGMQMCAGAGGACSRICHHLIPTLASMASPPPPGRLGSSKWPSSSHDLLCRYCLYSSAALASFKVGFAEEIIHHITYWTNDLCIVYEHFCRQHI